MSSRTRPADDTFSGGSSGPKTVTAQFSVIA